MRQREAISTTHTQQVLMPDTHFLTEKKKSISSGKQLKYSDIQRETHSCAIGHIIISYIDQVNILRVFN